MRPSARTSSVVPQRFGRCHLLPALTSLVRLQFGEKGDMEEDGSEKVSVMERVLIGK